MNVSLSHMLSSGRQEERSPFLYLIYKIRAKIVRVISWHQSFFGTIKPEERHSFIYWTTWTSFHRNLNCIVAEVNWFVEVFDFERLGAEPENHWMFPSVSALDGVRNLKFKVVWLRPQVRWLVHPDHEWVPVGDENPLANVKLGVVDQKRPLDVLLDHIPGPP